MLNHSGTQVLRVFRVRPEIIYKTLLNTKPKPKNPELEMNDTESLVDPEIDFDDWDGDIGVQEMS